LWDLIEYKIRQETIRFSKSKARERRKKKIELESRLKECEQKCEDSPTEESFRDFEIAKLE